MRNYLQNEFLIRLEDYGIITFDILPLFSNPLGSTTVCVPNFNICQLCSPGQFLSIFYNYII